MAWLQARLKKERKEGIEPGTDGSFQSRGLTFKKLWDGRYFVNYGA